MSRGSPIEIAPSAVSAVFSSLGADPYAFVPALHTQGAVLDTPFAAVVIGHEAAASVLRDHEHFSSVPDAGGGLPNLGLPVGSLGSLLGGRSMLSSDPPDHERLRGVVMRAFTPRTIAELEPRVREIAETLLEPLASGEPYELMDRLAAPLPVIVIAELLGIPIADRDLFKRWSNGLLAMNDLDTAKDGFASAEQSVRELSSYFLDVIAARRRVPRDDLISRLVEANAGGILSADELVRQCVLLLVAGNETTTHLIGNAAHTLALHPDAWHRLVDEPSRISNAVEEVLRYNGVVLGTARVACASAEIAGMPVDDGRLVFVFLAAANRDPARFDRPDVFDVDRSDATQHLALGGGIHYCLGAALARQEARVALETLGRVAPDWALADPAASVEYTLFLRGPKRLEIVANR